VLEFINAFLGLELPKVWVGKQRPSYVLSIHFVILLIPNPHISDP